MYLELENGAQIPICASQWPKMTNVHGRSWDVLATMKVGDEFVRIQADTTYGRSGYFSWQEKCYRVPVLSLMKYGLDRGAKQVMIKRGKAVAAEEL